MNFQPGTRYFNENFSTFNTLNAFVLKGDAPPRMALTLALAFKIVAIALIYALFFTPAHRQRPTPADTAAFFTAGSAKSE